MSKTAKEDIVVGNGFNVWLHVINQHTASAPVPFIRPKCKKLEEQELSRVLPHT